MSHFPLVMVSPEVLRSMTPCLSKEGNLVSDISTEIHHTMEAFLFQTKCNLTISYLSITESNPMDCDRGHVKMCRVCFYAFSTILSMLKDGGNGFTSKALKKHGERSDMPEQSFVGVHGLFFLTSMYCISNENSQPRTNVPINFFSAYKE